MEGAAWASNQEGNVEYTYAERIFLLTRLAGAAFSSILRNIMTGCHQEAALMEILRRNLKDKFVHARVWNLLRNILQYRVDN